MTTVLDTPTLLALDAAAKLDERIRVMANAAARDMDALAELVAKAKAGEIHEALEFDSWTSYVADALAPLFHERSRDERRRIVALLDDAGMSIRAIAEATGTPKSTVADDVHQLSGNRTADTDATTTTGLDGKRYQRRGRVGQRTRPTFHESVQNLAKRVDRVVKLANEASYVIDRESLDCLMEARSGIDLLISQING